MTELTSLTETDLAVVVRNIPKDLRVRMKTDRLYIAGGFIRELVSGKEPTDIDVFGSSAAVLDAAASALADSREGHTHTIPTTL